MEDFDEGKTFIEISSVIRRISLELLNVHMFRFLFSTTSILSHIILTGLVRMMLLPVRRFSRNFI